jgi:hypothetical protein
MTILANFRQVKLGGATVEGRTFVPVELDAPKRRRVASYLTVTEMVSVYVCDGNSSVK